MKKTHKTFDTESYAELTSASKQPLTRAWEADIARALEVLRHGGVIVYPTDTIWGIGCDATNEEAVRKVFALKGRADAKAMLSLVDSDGRLQRYVRNVPDVAWQIVDCATNPITIIYADVQGLAPSLLAEDGSAGLRITQETFSRELCRRFGRPIVSTSANVSGLPPPRCFDDIDADLLARADYVCTSRRNERAPSRASSIIKIGRGAEIEIIRK
ncbi:MAG: Sua5/YciO/YrdC/YwlC family protein [Alloprevotella sp.]|nr:Sua5/YciO/YrdC/YwlC family protein [Alloprevotella sp.]